MGSNKAVVALVIAVIVMVGLVAVGNAFDKASCMQKCIKELTDLGSVRAIAEETCFRQFSLVQVPMDFRLMGLDSPLFHALHHLVDDNDKSAPNAPTQTYFRDAKAMAATPADVKEYPNSYVFIIDMPGLKSGDIKVQVEDDSVLVISGERKREEEEGAAKYVRMERRIGKFMRKFVLPENANIEAISAVCQDGVLTVTVQKLPPREPKKPKTVEVKIA
ncbi:hypothetical protein RJ639_029682 [Escallonia herrerae]|uniref:SHSP domain-containing protein n=1 Tax=Escallonia herrerae TaxID=1293975 RepID=A0AA88X841_9ASTE|nr:hypothetical protein RJ639_029682 [Escallonia herrerae]